MIRKRNKIKKLVSFSVLRAGFSIAFLLLLVPLNAQVISNYGAAIVVSPGHVVEASDAGNILSGTILNDGTINLSGNYQSTAFTQGSGLFQIGGNWNNTGVLSGFNTVTFNGLNDQTIIRPLGETFYNLIISKTGATSARVVLANNVEVTKTLTLSKGNIDVTGFKLFLSNRRASSLNYISGTRSRIFGKFERGIDESGTYLFPLGTPAYYNPANLVINDVPTGGSVLSEFITAPPPGNAGLPTADPPVEIYKSYTSGFWRLKSNGFSSSNMSVNLTGNGFTDTIFDVTRVIKRTDTGNWTVDGVHADAFDSVVYRNNLTGNISTGSTDLALARIRPLITTNPADVRICEEQNAVFSVVATGTGPLTYIWYKDGVAIPSGPHYSGNRLATMTILNVDLTDVATYYVVVRDRDGNRTTSLPATLTVDKIPRATLTPSVQNHECSGLPFDNIVLGESYGVPLATFIWSRNNPAGITSAMPLSGTSLVIGDMLAGSFINSTDNPIVVTFTIIPTGPIPTNCVGRPVTATITINPTPRAIPVNVKPAICYDASTLITLTTPTTMTNGIIQFDYTVSASDPSVIGFTTGGINDLPVNHNIIFPYKNNSNTVQSVYYDITPKNTASGCTAGTPVRAEVKIHPHPLQSDIIITKPLTCDGGSDASIHIDISTGTGPGYMHWYGPQGFPTIQGPGLTDFTNVPGGQYDVTVTDDLGCISTATKSISGAVIDSRLLIVPKAPLGFGTTCPGLADGRLGVRQNTSSTGTAPFDYQIVYNSTVVASGTLTTTGYYDYHNNLPAGTYTLYLRDANGCMDYFPREVTIVEPPKINITFGKQVYAGGYNVSCRGYSNGSVWVQNAEGGNSGPYTYLWSTTDGVITGPNNTDRLDNIPKGKYYLLTKDVNNCAKLDSVILTEPEGMYLVDDEVSMSHDGNYNISCSGGNDGFIRMNIAGGSGTYLYSWTSTNGFTSTSEDISGLRAGTYTCTVRDLNGCILAPVPVYILTEPSPLVATATPSLSAHGSYNINCFGGTGSIGLSVAGGSTGTYTYDWSTTNGSGIVPGQEDQNSLTAGTYTVIVRDLNGCTVTLQVVLTQPQQLALTLSPTHISCLSANFDNGAISLSVSGGVAPLNYSWSNGASTKDLSNLVHGNYRVTVTDANGCSATGSVDINLPPPLTYSKAVSLFNGFNINCYNQANGFIRIDITSGTAPFTFHWTGPDGFTSDSKDIFGLKAGNYVLTITDQNFCSVTESITLTQPGKLDMSVTVSQFAGGFNISCAGGNTGTITVLPVNQVSYLNYIWSDGSADNIRTNLTAGDYGLIITDLNNCHADTVITLTEPDKIQTMFDVTLPSCSVMPDGEIRLIASGGVPGVDYSYLWSDRSTTRDISSIIGGIYRVTVTDLNGCSAKDSIFIKPVNEVCLVIPNAISPNGDLINDVWNIGMKELYPDMEITIINRWGEAVWKSDKGYSQPWDGRSNGSQLPVDSYHYIIDLHNKTKPILGSVTIVR